MEPQTFRRYFNTISLITFIGGGIALIFALLYAYFWSELEIMLALGDEKSLALKESIIKAISLKEWNTMEQEGTLGIYYSGMLKYYLVASVSHLSSILAVVFMRFKKAKAFWLYVFSHVLYLSAPFFTVYHFKPLWGELFIFAFVSAVFIFLYYRVYLQLNKNE